MAESIAPAAGLGYRMMENTNQMDTAGTMAGIVILMLIVVILNSLLDKAEDYFLRWRPKESDTRTTEEEGMTASPERVAQLEKNVEFRCPVMNLLRAADVKLNVTWETRPAG